MGFLYGFLINLRWGGGATSSKYPDFFLVKGLFFDHQISTCPIISACFLLPKLTTSSQVSMSSLSGKSLRPSILELLKSQFAELRSHLTAELCDAVRAAATVPSLPSRRGSREVEPVIRSQPSGELSGAWHDWKCSCGPPQPAFVQQLA